MRDNAITTYKGIKVSSADVYDATYATLHATWRKDGYEAAIDRAKAAIKARNNTGLKTDRAAAIAGLDFLRSWL